MGQTEQDRNWTRTQNNLERKRTRPVWPND